MDESPRYEFSNGEFEKGVEILDKICISNKKMSIDLLYSNARDDISLWSQKQRSKAIRKGSLSLMFTDKYRKITLILWFNWITLSFCYFGIILYMP